MNVTISAPSDLAISESLVNYIFDECRENDLSRVRLYDSCMITGISMIAFLRLDVLQKYENRINRLFDDMPALFHENEGDGWTLSMMVYDRQKRKWANSEKSIERLLILGLAIDRIVFPFAREVWYKLPYGHPYVMIRAINEEPTNEEIRQKTTEDSGQYRQGSP